MFGSSSTTSSRASGVARPAGELPATDPPVARAEAIVMPASVASQAGAALDATCELPEGGSRRGRHGAAAAPVPDRVVLRPPQTPAPAQIRPDRTDGAGLGGNPGEDVVPVRPVERGDGVGEQRALPG